MGSRLISFLGPLENAWWRKRLLLIAVGCLVTPVFALFAILGSQHRPIDSLSLVTTLVIIWVIQLASALAYAHAVVPVVRDHRRRVQMTMTARSRARADSLPIYLNLLLFVGSLVLSVVVWGFIDAAAVWWIALTTIVLSVIANRTVKHVRDRRRRQASGRSS